ncbi:MAG: glycosyltransferase family 2 protein [Planctomycetes bacterium]|nr:glycosyltransferase family 2 protein [Planctomycetota bacterium]
MNSRLDDRIAMDSAWAVPAHTVQEYSPRTSSYALCVFVLNEGERVLSQLRKMQPPASQVDIVIADGGSTDGALSEHTLRPLGVNTLLTKTGPGKLSAQMRMAFAYALARGYQGVIVMDGNDKDDPRAVPAFVAALEAGFDHVQGSRFIPGGKAVRTPWLRWWGIRFVHAPLVSCAAGSRYTDTTNGFRAYSRQLLLDPRVAPFREVFSAYELHYYLAIRAARLGFRTCEVPVTRSYPGRGKTPTKIHGWRGNCAVLRTLLAACRHRFDPT